MQILASYQTWYADSARCILFNNKVIINVLLLKIVTRSKKSQQAHQLFRKSQLAAHQHENHCPANHAAATHETHYVHHAMPHEKTNLTYMQSHRYAESQ